MALQVKQLQYVEMIIKYGLPHYKEKIKQKSPAAARSRFIFKLTVSIR